MAQIIAIHRSAEHRAPMESLDEVTIIEDYGLEGDRQARKGRLGQVLLMPGEVLEDLNIEPGQTRENLTTQGIDVMTVPLGARLKVGAVVLEITKAATPCHHMDDVRPGLQGELAGQRGVLARVLEGGQVQKGDSIEVLG
jgi:MOSC domain-containing protein YiiM